jgi:hypothetical protein
MERAGRALSQMITARKALSPEDMTMAAWPAAIGKRLARRTRALSLVRDRLVVEVEDAVWQRNLHQLRGPILKNLREILGDAAPLDLEFRIGIPRRPPQREDIPDPFAVTSVDEADLIADPMLSRLYRISRRKAGA